MEEVDRALFVPEDMKQRAYEDKPLPIGRGQTISQPYIVAYMVQTLEIEPDHKVLEIGTGCGYNAAILSRLCKQVYSIEIIEWLGEQAKENLKNAGIKNVSLKVADGYKGWPEEAPFDRIILTAAAPEIPQPLKVQLAVGGKLLAPVGRGHQILKLLEKTGEDEYEERKSLPVRFVNMTGEAQE
jgi:protein-L-isoaspartate(D-aspartate) O-methyltransferase